MGASAMVAQLPTSALVMIHLVTLHCQAALLLPRWFLAQETVWE